MSEEEGQQVISIQQVLGLILLSHGKNGVMTITREAIESYKDDGGDKLLRVEYNPDDDVVEVSFVEHQ